MLPTFLTTYLKERPMNKVAKQRVIRNLFKIYTERKPTARDF